MRQDPRHQPRRGSDVELWLKSHRDEYERWGVGISSFAWYAIDMVLDDYRLRADTGSTLTAPAPEEKS
jgi:hypothetical protein